MATSAVAMPVHGEVRCYRCGYSLLGLPSRRCPECGTEHTARSLATGARPREPRRWSARTALLVARAGWTTAAAAAGALALFAAAAEAWPVTPVCIAAAGLAGWRRVDLAWRPGRLERMDGLLRAELGVTLLLWAALWLAAVLALAAVGALVLWTPLSR